MNLFAFEAATEAVEPTIEPIVTPYSDVTVPMSNVILIAASAVLLIAFAVVAVILINRHFTNYITGGIIGAAAWLLFCYLAPTGLSILLQMIPAVKAKFDADPVFFNVINLCVSMILECLGLYLGMKYCDSSNIKRHTVTHVGCALAFGVGAYIAMITMSQYLLSFPLEYTIISTTINSMGFDQSVTSMVQSGITEEEAIESILSLVNEDAIGFLLNSLSFVFKAIVMASAAVVAYGVITEKVEGKWMFAAFGMTALFYIPMILSASISPNVVINLALCVLIAVAAAAVAIYLIRTFMPEDLELFKTSKKQKRAEEKEKEKKIPHIVMPKD